MAKEPTPYHPLSMVILAEGPLSLPPGPMDWSVWIGLPDEDPVDGAFGFCIAHGRTRDEALARAVAAIEDVERRLQSADGVPERAS